MKETTSDKKQDSTLHVVIVLDRSGSMGEIQQSTIDAFNAFVDKQRKEPGAETTLFSLYLFSDTVQRLWSNVPIGQVTNITQADYLPNGQTALLDAIGTAVKETEQQQLDDVLVVTLTDGQENHSRIYGFVTVRDCVLQKSTENWEFIWLGSDGGSRHFAQMLGIPPENIELFAVTEEGIHDSCSKISDSISLKKQSGSTSGWKGDAAAPTAPVKKSAHRKKHSKSP
ncbi:VWA domain-containing protein [Methanoregula sp.]|jgi:uncharacterized protein YegL|uniref:VWA domain-containing protein n=1 Tax=Methanoregula sp. TaxID=2052170 RepID=UPI003C1D5E61